jgi:hypothetical protein
LMRTSFTPFASTAFLNNGGSSSLPFAAQLPYGESSGRRLMHTKTWRAYGGGIFFSTPEGPLTRCAGPRKTKRRPDLEGREAPLPREIDQLATHTHSKLGSHPDCLVTYRHDDTLHHICCSLGHTCSPKSRWGRFIGLESLCDHHATRRDTLNVGYREKI